MACARGGAGGCTNRAAGLRNGRFADEPLKDLSPDDQRTCEFRSFSLACERNDAWGCAMLGQDYRNGEGVGKDTEAAKRAFDKSCALSPNFAACRFAKSFETDDDASDE